MDLLPWADLSLHALQRKKDVEQCVWGLSALPASLKLNIWGLT